MAISAVRLQNFKSFAQTDTVRLSPGLNVIIGRNNTGKSSFLDAVKLAAEICVSGAINPHPALSMRGGFADVAFGKDAANAVAIELEFQNPRDAGVEAPAAQLANITDCRLIITCSSDSAVRREVQLAFADGRETLHLGFEGRGQSSQTGEYLFDSTTTVESLDRVRRLPADRMVAAEIEVRGEDRLSENGSNLIRVLNTLASSDPRAVTAILAGVRQIEPEIQEVLAKLVPNEAKAAGTVVEEAFPAIEFAWGSLASGTQQLILLLTFLYASPYGSVLLIEEPELYLHAESIWKLLGIMDRVSKAHSKQIILTTHSPLIVEAVGFEGLFVCTKDAAGASGIHSLQGFESLDKFLQQRGLMLHHFLRPKETGVRELPEFILVVEGPEDVPVWVEFVRLGGLDPARGKVLCVEPGGWAEAAKTGSLLSLLTQLGVGSVPFLVVVEADDNPDEKRAYLESVGLSEDAFHILPREMEAYLMNETAIHKVVYKSESRVRDAMVAAKGKPSKGKLEAILKILGEPRPSSYVKASLARNLPKLPPPVRRVVSRLKRLVKAAGS